MSQISPNLIPLERSDDKKRSIVLGNTIKMVSNRGFINTDDIEFITQNFDQRTEDDIYKVTFSKKMNKYKHLYIKFLNQKITAMGKNSILVNFLQKYEDSKKILIVGGINNKIKSTIYSNYPDTEIFTVNEMMINLVDHILVPQHILLSEEESLEILQEYDARKRDMPKILDTDAVARYYNMPIGRICRIIRPSETSGDTPYYRLVVKDHT